MEKRTDSPADEVAAYLAEIQRDLSDGAAYPHRVMELHVPRLLAAVERALAHHIPEDAIYYARHPFRYCSTCSGHPKWPCPEVAAIKAALRGERP